MKKLKIIILITGLCISTAIAEPYIGEIRMFAGNFAPQGWAKCDGQILEINENDALFSLLGTTYGGDGRTTFGLPDLRGRIPIHQGQEPGLPNFTIGSKGGNETVTLTVDQIPSHNHSLHGSDGEATATDPSNRIIARVSNGIPIYGDKSIQDMIATQSSGGDQSHSNMQPFINCTYIIALYGIYPSVLKDIKETKDESYIGEVKMFGFNFAPRNWTKCDGQLLPINQYQALFSLLGTIYGGDGRTTFGLPDLRGRTPIHHGNSGGIEHYLGSKGGEDRHTLSIDEIPSHNHLISCDSLSGESTSPMNMNFANNEEIPTYGEQDNVTLNSSSLGNTGGGQAHENIQPYLTINYCISLSGVYPSQYKDEKDDSKDIEPFIGEICIFTYNFAPRGFAYCDGQMLNIAENTALFSLLGITYGGDGRTTFGLPNIQGRTVMHPGTGPGLTPRVLGQMGGSETVTLTCSQIPSHNHMLRFSPIAEYQSPEDRFISNHVFNNFSSGFDGSLNSNSISYIGNGQAHNNMQPYTTMSFCIAIEGLYPSRPKEIV